MAQEIVRSTRGIKSRRLKGHARLTKKITICLASIICCLSFVAIGVLASVTKLELNIDNSAYYYATAFNKNGDDEFMLTSYNDLVLMSELVNSNALIPDTNIYYRDAKYLLTADIDPVQEAISAGVSEQTAKSGTYPLNPIGTNSTSSFRGEFNGNGHTISNITITLTSGGCYGGLFGYTEGATISGVGIGTPEDIADNGTYTAPKTCTYNFDLSGKTITIAGFGGIVGFASANQTTNKLTEITECYNYADITISGNWNYSGSGTNGTGVAGIAGITSGATIKNCYNTGNLVANSFMGCIYAGISCQFTPNADRVNNCYNIGSFTDKSEENIINLYYSLVASIQQKTTTATDGNALYTIGASGVTQSGENSQFTCYECYKPATTVKYSMLIDSMAGEDCLTATTGMSGLQNQIDGKDIWHATKNTSQMFKFPQLAIFEKHHTTAEEQTQISNKTDSTLHYGIFKTVEIRDFHNFLYDPYGLYNAFTSANANAHGGWYHTTTGKNKTVINHTTLNETTKKFEIANTGIQDYCPTPPTSAGEGSNIQLTFKIGTEVIIYATPKAGFEVAGIFLVKSKNSSTSTNNYLQDYFYFTENADGTITFLHKNTANGVIATSCSDITYIPASALTNTTLSDGSSAYALGAGANKLIVKRNAESADGSGCLQYNGENYYQFYTLYTPKSFGWDSVKDNITPGIYGNYYPQTEAELQRVHDSGEFEKRLIFDTRAGGYKLTQSCGDLKFNDFTNTKDATGEDTTNGNAISFYHNGYIGSASYKAEDIAKYHTIRLTSVLENIELKSQYDSTKYLKPYIFYGFYDLSNADFSSIQSAMQTTKPIAGPRGETLLNLLGLTTSLVTPATQDATNADNYYIDLVPFVDKEGKIVCKMLMPNGTLSTDSYSKIMPLFITNTADYSLQLQCFDGDIYTEEHEIDMEAQTENSLATASGPISFVNTCDNGLDLSIGLSKSRNVWWAPCLKKTIPMPAVIGGEINLTCDEYYGFNFVGFYTTQYGGVNDGKIEEVSGSQSTSSNYDQEKPNFASANFHLDANAIKPFSKIVFYIRYSLKQVDVNLKAVCYDDKLGTKDDTAVTGFADKIGYFTVHGVRYIVGNTVVNGSVQWGDYTLGTFEEKSTSLAIKGIASNGRIFFKLHPRVGWRLDGFYLDPALTEESKINANTTSTTLQPDGTADTYYFVSVGQQSINDLGSTLYIKFVPDNVEVSIGTAYEGDYFANYTEPATAQTGATATMGGTVDLNGYIANAIGEFEATTHTGIYGLALPKVVSAGGSTAPSNYYKFTLTATAKKGYAFKGWYGVTTQNGKPLNTSGELTASPISNPNSNKLVLTLVAKGSTLVVDGGTTAEYYGVYAVFAKDVLTLPDILRVGVTDTENTPGGSLFGGVAGVIGYDGTSHLDRAVHTQITANSSSTEYKRVTYSTGTSGNSVGLFNNSWVRIYIAQTTAGYTFKDYSNTADSYFSLVPKTSLTENLSSSGEGLGSGFYIYVQIGVKNGESTPNATTGHFNGAIKKVAIPVQQGTAGAVDIATQFETNTTTTVKIISQDELTCLYARYDRIPVQNAVHAVNGMYDLAGTGVTFNPSAENHGDSKYSPALNTDLANYTPDLMGYVTLTYTTGRLAGSTEVHSTYFADGTCNHLALSGDPADKFMLTVHVRDGFKIKSVNYYSSTLSNGKPTLLTSLTDEPFNYNFYSSTTAKNYQTANNILLSGYNNNEEYYILLPKPSVYATSIGYGWQNFVMGTNDFKFTTSTGNSTAIRYIAVAFEPKTYQINYEGNDKDIFGDQLIYWQTGATTPTTGQNVVTANGTIAKTNHSYTYRGSYNGLTNCYVNKADDTNIYSANGYDFVGWGLYNASGKLLYAITTDSKISGTTADKKLKLQTLISRLTKTDDICENLFVYASSLTTLDGANAWYDTTYRKVVSGISGTVISYGDSKNLQKELFASIIDSKTSSITMKALWLPKNLNTYEKTYLVLHKDTTVGTATGNVNASNYSSLAGYGAGYDKAFEIANLTAFIISDQNGTLTLKYTNTNQTFPLATALSKTGYKLVGFTNMLGSDGGTTVKYDLNRNIIIDGKNFTVQDDPTASALYMDLNPTMGLADYTAGSSTQNPYCTIENITLNGTTIKAKFLHLYAVWQKQVNIYQGTVSTGTNFVDRVSGNNSNFGTLIKTKNYNYRFDISGSQTLDLALSSDTDLTNGLTNAFNLYGYMNLADVFTLSPTVAYSWGKTSFTQEDDSSLFAKLKTKTTAYTSFGDTENICLIYTKQITGGLITGVYTSDNVSNTLSDKNKYTGYEISTVTQTRYYYITKTTEGVFAEDITSPFVKLDAGDGYIYFVANGTTLSGVRLSATDNTLQVKVKSGSSYVGNFITTTLKLAGYTNGLTSFNASDQTMLQTLNTNSQQNYNKQLIYGLNNTLSPVSMFDGASTPLQAQNSYNYLTAIYMGDVPLKVYFNVDGNSANSIGSRKYLTYDYNGTSTGAWVQSGAYTTLSTMLNTPSGNLQNQNLYFCASLTTLGTSIQPNAINMPVVDQNQTLGTGLTGDIAEWADYTFDGWVTLSGGKISRVWNTSTKTVTKWFGDVDDGESDGTNLINRSYYIDYDNSPDQDHCTKAPAVAGLGLSVYPVFKYHTLVVSGDLDINPIIVDPSSELTLEDVKYEYNLIKNRFTYDPSTKKFTGRATFNTGDGNAESHLTLKLSTKTAKTLTFFAKYASTSAGGYDWLINASYTISNGTTGTINLNNTTGTYTTVNLPANTTTSFEFNINVPAMFSSLANGNYGELSFDIKYSSSSGSKPLFLNSDELLSTSNYASSVEVVKSTGMVTITSDSSIKMTGSSASPATAILKFNLTQPEEDWGLKLGFLSTLATGANFTITYGTSLNSAGTDIQSPFVFSLQKPTTTSLIQPGNTYYEGVVTYNNVPETIYVKFYLNSSGGAWNSATVQSVLGYTYYKGQNNGSVPTAQPNTLFTTGTNVGAVKEGTSVGIIAGYTASANTKKLVAKWSLYNANTRRYNTKTESFSGKEYMYATADFMRVDIVNTLPANIFAKLTAEADSDFKEILFDLNTTSIGSSDCFVGTVTTTNQAEYYPSVGGVGINASGQLIRYGMYRTIQGVTEVTGGAVVQSPDSATIGSTTNRKETISANRSGYVLTGWYTQKVGGQKILDYAGNMSTDNGCESVYGYSTYYSGVGRWNNNNTIVLYAQWEEAGDIAIVCNNPSSDEAYHDKINNISTTNIDASGYPHHHVTTDLTSRLTVYSSAPSGAVQPVDNNIHDSSYPYWVITRNSQGQVTKFVPFADSTKTTLCSDYVVFIRHNAGAVEIYLTKRANGMLADRVVNDTATNDYTGLPLPVQRETNGNYKTNADGTKKFLKDSTWLFEGFYVTSSSGADIQVANALGKLSSNANITNAIEVTDNKPPVIYAKYSRNSVKVVLDANTSFSNWPMSGWKDYIGSGTFADGSSQKEFYIYKGASGLYLDKNCTKRATYTASVHSVNRASTDPFYTLQFDGWVYYTNNNSMASGATESKVLGTSWLLNPANSTFVTTDASAGREIWNYSGDLKTIYLNSVFNYKKTTELTKYVLELVQGTALVRITNSKQSGLDVKFNLSYTTEDNLTFVSGLSLTMGNAYTVTTTDITTAYNNNPTAYADINTVASGAKVYKAYKFTVRLAKGGQFEFYGYVDSLNYSAFAIFSLPTLTDNSVYQFHYTTRNKIDDDYVVAEGPIWFYEDVPFASGNFASGNFTTSTILQIQSKAIINTNCHYLQTNPNVAYITTKNSSGTIISRHAYLSQALQEANNNSSITTIQIQSGASIFEYLPCEKKSTSATNLTITTTSTAKAKVYFLNETVAIGLQISGGTTTISKIKFGSLGAFKNQTGNACINVTGSSTKLNLQDSEFNVTISGDGAVINAQNINTLSLSNTVIDSYGKGYGIKAEGIPTISLTNCTLNHYGTIDYKNGLFAKNCTSVSITGSTLHSSKASSIMLDNSSATCNGSTISTSKAFSGIIADFSSLTLTGSNTFSDCSTAILLYKATLNINSAPTFTNNYEDIYISSVNSYSTAPVKWNVNSKILKTIKVYTSSVGSSSNFPWRIIEFKGEPYASESVAFIKTNRYAAESDDKYIILIDAANVRLVNRINTPEGILGGYGLYSGEELRIEYGTVVDGVLDLRSLKKLSDNYVMPYKYKLRVNGKDSGYAINDPTTLTLNVNASFFEVLDDRRDKGTGLFYQYLPIQTFHDFIDQIQSYFLENYSCTYQEYLKTRSFTSADKNAIQSAYDNTFKADIRTWQSWDNHEIPERFANFGWFAFTSASVDTQDINWLTGYDTTYLKPNLLSFVVDSSDKEAFSYVTKGKTMPKPISPTPSGGSGTVSASTSDPVRYMQDFDFSIVVNNSILQDSTKAIVITLVKPVFASSKVSLRDANQSGYPGTSSNSTTCFISFNMLNSGEEYNMYDILVVIRHA